MLKSRQIEQRIKLLQRETSPPKQWKKSRLLSLKSSGDLKWSEDTVKRHSNYNYSNPGGKVQRYANNIGSPRGDVELSDFRMKPLISPRVHSPSRIDCSANPSRPVLQPRASDTQQRQRCIGPLQKIYISPQANQIMREQVQLEIGAFPATLSNLALVLQNNPRILESVFDELSTTDELDGLQAGLMTVSLSEEETERDIVRTNKRISYKSALGGIVSTGNNQFINSWLEFEKATGEVFLWGRDINIVEDEKKDDEDVVIFEGNASDTGIEKKTIILTEGKQSSAIISVASPPRQRPQASAFVNVTSTPSRTRPSKKKAFATKVLPKKALSLPVKAKIKSSIKAISAKSQKKKDPINLSIDNFRKVIQNKIGEAKWNKVFRNRPHHLTIKVIQEAETRLEKKIQRLEESRTSKVDEILAKKKEEEQRRQASERASSLMRPLTAEEESIVQAALFGIGPPNEILASQDAESIQRQSLQRLQPGQWLNDEVINYFLKICLAKRDENLCAAQPGRKRSHFFNSYFVQTMFDEKNNNLSLRGQYAYKNVKRWSKKVPGKDIFNLKYIYCPINLDNVHWTSACIFMEEKKIQYYDSMHGTDWKKLKGLLEYIKDEWRVKNGGEMDVTEWELVGCTDDTPGQLNGFDCGVFTCMFGDFISNDCPLVFNQNHINQCRQRIALSILKNCAIV